MSVSIDATSTAVVVSGSDHSRERTAVLAFIAGYANPRTREAYTHDLTQIQNWCARNGLSLLSLQRPHVELYLRDLEQRGYAPASIGRRLTCLRSFFAYCCDEDWVMKNPCARIKAPKIPEKAMPYLRHLDCEAFLRGAEQLGPKENALACLLLFNALRVSEVCQRTHRGHRRGTRHDDAVLRRQGHEVRTGAARPEDGLRRAALPRRSR